MSSATTANAWLAVGGACLTAGSSSTPSTSIAPCGAQAPADIAGAGALQLTNGANFQYSMIVGLTALPTANGLQLSFNDYAFNGTSPGADGISFFLSDASKPVPTAAGALGGSLAYANGNQAGTNLPGIANAYVGVGLDEYGNFSSPAEGRNGGPGPISQTIAVRGSASTNWAYLGGAQNTSGQAVSLPFALNTPAATTRPANAPTIVATLTPAGLLTVSIDRHDGNGALAYYSKTIVGVNGEPAVPSKVYFGFTASTGGLYSRHQISALTIAAFGTYPPQDNLTFHQNAMRTGWYNGETTLTTSNVSGTTFGALASLTPPPGMPAFGKVYAQPLYVANENGPDGRAHNLVIIATATDQVYAFDELTRAVVWHRDYTNAAAGIRQQLWSDTNCTDISPDVGITGTPVIDRAKDVMYFVVATMENGKAFLRLHAIALSTGNEIASTSVTGSTLLATGGTANLDPVTSNARSALLEANNNIYVSLGSHCDFFGPSTHGWMIAYSASTLQQTGNLANLTNADPGNSQFLGSVWMSGYGPAADTLGNIYFATGNGPFNGTTDFSMSVLKVPGNLNLAAASYFTPATAAADSNADRDLGSGGVMLLPDQAANPTHLLIAGGKCQAFPPNSGPCLKYILNRDAMGGQQTGDAGALWKADTGGGIWGGPAYFQDAGSHQYIVYGGGQPLTTYSVVSPVGLAIESSANVGCLECTNGGSQPVVSSNGTIAGTAIVWALKTPTQAGGTIGLYAFDALHMNRTLFSATAGNWTAAPGTGGVVGGALVSPLIANGKVYVPADGAVTVFGLH